LEPRIRYATRRNHHNPLPFRDGDKLFTVDGEPVESIVPLARAIQAFHLEDADAPTWSIMRDGQKVVMTTERKTFDSSDAGSTEKPSSESTDPSQ
jgi:hypothetical protein